MSRILNELHSRDIPSPSAKDLWTSTAIDKILSNEKYIGIIDAVTFEAVQAERQNRSNTIITDKGKQQRKSIRFSSGNSLSGKIQCGECGRNFRRITTHSGEIVWRCAGRVEKHDNCNAETVKQSGIDELLKKKLGNDIFVKDIYGIIENIIINKSGIVIDIKTYENKK